MSEYFTEPKSFGKREWKLNHICLIMQQKSDLKTEAGVDTLKFAKEVDLVNLKSDLDELEIEKLKNVPTNLSTLNSR